MYCETKHNKGQQQNPCRYLSNVSPLTWKSDYLLLNYFKLSSNHRCLLTDRWRKRCDWCKLSSSPTSTAKCALPTGSPVPRPSSPTPKLLRSTLWIPTSCFVRLPAC